MQFVDIPRLEKLFLGCQQSNYQRLSEQTESDARAKPMGVGPLVGKVNGIFLSAFISLYDKG